MSNKIYPALNERIAEALTDDFNFSEGLLKELSAIINRVIEDYSKAGLPFTKALAELEQPEPGEFTKLARSCIPPREVFDNIPITEISERPGILENVVHTACDIIDRQNAKLKQQAEEIESNNFWKDIILTEEGKLNVEQVKQELVDFHFMIKEVPRVYMYVTGGKLSKCNYYASSVISAAADYIQSVVEEACRSKP